MFRKGLHRLRFLLNTTTKLVSLVAIATIIATTAQAQSANVRGKILDPLGNPVAQAKVTLVLEGREDKSLADSTSAADGTYQLQAPGSGRYAVRVEATGFDSQTSEFVYIGSNNSAGIDVNLRVGTLSQQIVVSSTGTPTLETQVGASVSVIDHSDLENQHQLNIADALRLQPGLQIATTGQRGGTTSLYVRGGQSDFNKLLIDGIPANDIGGAFDFGDLSSTAVDQVEILRGPNSVLYGPDAIASVINVTTTRGTTIEPEFNYSIDGGNFDSYRNDVSVSGAFHQFDYFSEFSRFDTRNSLPNSAFHDATYAGNFGWTPTSATDIRFTVRHTANGLGSPNALDFFGIPDDSFQHNRYTYWGCHAPESNHQEVAQHPEIRLRSAERGLRQSHADR